MADAPRKRVSKDDAFARDPFDATPIEYEDETEWTIHNLDTGEISKFKAKALCMVGGNIPVSPAIRAYYERERKLREQNEQARRRSA